MAKARRFIIAIELYRMAKVTLAKTKSINSVYRKVAFTLCSSHFSRFLSFARGKGRSTNKKADLRPLFILFLCEISFKKSLKCFTVSCFVPCHFMYCIVDCIKTLFFSKLCKLCFTESCTVFCRCSHFKIFLC